MYDYRQAVKEDVLEYIRHNYNAEELKDLLDDREKFEEMLNEDLWTEDSVTGNGSGSYTFNRYKAEKYICHNLDLLAEAVEDFGCNMDVLKNGAEACDVTIRCYLLWGAIYDALDELESEMGE